jgi:hypothetical protein
MVKPFVILSLVVKDSAIANNGSKVVAASCIGMISDRGCVSGVDDVVSFENVDIDDKDTEFK